MTSIITNLLINMLKCFKKPHNDSRQFYIMNKNNGNIFCKNDISTTRYTFFSFIPVFLFSQFKKSSNLYYLFVALLQQIPGLSPLGRYISPISLMIVIFILAIKEIYEDIKRSLSDAKINKLPCTIFNINWKKAKWEQIKVGDLVRISSGETVPADMIILTTSEPNHICYIQTASLDGETSYKIRYSPSEFYCYLTEEKWNNCKVKITCDNPNKYIYRFKGKAEIESKEPFPINNNHTLLRGCKLRNTSWVIGIVVYTGSETKITLNSISTPIKRSSIDRGIDNLTFVLYGVLIILTLTSTLLCEYANKYIVPKHWYLKFEKKEYSYIFTTLTYFILYHNIIPISVLVTAELVKFIQAYIINMDKLMYAEKSLYMPVVKTCNILEDLGIVNYIISDKTGTLTRNEMILREISIGRDHYKFDQNLWNNLIKDKTKLRDYNFYMFITNLLLCNNVISEYDKDKNILLFNSSSPDEVAIINMLYDYDFKFISRSRENVEIEYQERKETWKIIYTLDFTSERKRMDVIVKSSNGKFYLFLKGADTVVLKMIQQKDSENFESALQYLELFSKQGLRTLCLAYKELTEKDVHLFMTEIENLQSKNAVCDTEIYLAFEKIEKNLIILGCTGIEDQLQDNVPDTVDLLRNANIKFWMLTGDRLETAINIGYATNLIKDSVKMIPLNSQNEQDCLNKLVNIANEESICIENKIKIKNPAISLPISLIISGNDVKYITTEKCLKYFINIAVHCQTVICCRVSPSQKQELLLLVKNYVYDSCTLAIGDGANDCSMIKAANVGVGIIGKEGLQAANTADFAIDQFQILSRLLLVHGSLSYRRICNCIYFVFYKNMVINIFSFYLSFSNLYSGKSLFTNLHLPFFNNFYTFFPPLCFGLLDRVSSLNAQMNLPYLYQSVRKSYRLGSKRFIFWCINALYHSFAIYFLYVFGLSTGVYNIQGNTISSELLATWICGQIVILISLKASLEIRNWSLLSQFGLWVGYLIYVIFVFIFSRRLPQAIWIEPRLLDHDILLLTSPLFYMSLPFPLFVLLPDFIYHCIRNTWFTPSHLFVTSVESSKDFNWSDKILVNSFSSELNILSEKKNIRTRKYFGFAFSASEK